MDHLSGRRVIDIGSELGLVVYVDMFSSRSDADVPRAFTQFKGMDFFQSRGRKYGECGISPASSGYLLAI
jgi:hypothetical protein